MVFILQFGNAHVGDSIHGDHVNEVHSSYAKDLVHSPHSVSGRKNGLLYKVLFSSICSFSPILYRKICGFLTLSWLRELGSI